VHCVQLNSFHMTQVVFNSSVHLCSKALYTVAVVSVCLSITLVYCVKMTKCIATLFTLPTVLVISWQSNQPVESCHWHF